MRSSTQLRQEVKRVGVPMRPWIEALARLGYAAKGVVYGLIGFLALQAAFGLGSPNINQGTVFEKIVTQPFGKFLLWIVIVGLIGYALWRILLSTLDLEYEGSHGMGLVKRIGYLISGLVYLGLAYLAYQIVNGKSNGGGNTTQDMTAGIFKIPGGQIIVGIVGVIILCVGLFSIYSAYRQSFEKRFRWGRMSSEERKVAVRLGRFGYAIRGLIFSLIGIFLIQAAATFNPSKAGGLGDALVALAKQPYGPVIVGVVGLGLIAFGVYCLALARYREIRVDIE